MQASAELKMDKTTASLNKATNHIRNGNLKIALNQINKILKKKPGEERALALKAHIYEKKGDHQKTFDLINQALASSPDTLPYKFMQASSLVRLEKYDAAKISLLNYLNIDPLNPNALKLMSIVLHKLGDDPANLITLFRLAALVPLNDAQKQALFSLSIDVHIFSFSEQVKKGFLNILQYDEINTISLMNNARNYILSKYNLGEENLKINLSEVIEDKLLIALLRSVRVPNTAVDKFTTTLRETILVLALKDDNIDSKFLPLAQSLGLYGFLNEYVSYIKENEKEMLAQATALLKIQVSCADWQPKESEGLLLIIAMYQNLYELDFVAQLLAHPLKTWPSSLYKIAEEALFNIHEEIETAKKVASLGEIKDEVSLEVQQHYEENPYPRWTNLYFAPLKSIGSLVLNTGSSVEEQLPKALFDPKTPMLIAGCGTGFQAVAAARRLPDSHISAIDISRRSLAYSKIKARQKNVDNIDFYHADILELPESMGKFHYIECCGVLHHMADPLAGWKKLLDFLEPGGVMKIAVYSKNARKDISAERNKIAALNMPATRENIRLYRHALFNQKPLPKIAMILTDLFSLSECRDLLFHQHEQCYTWPEIETICKDLNLRFLGLSDNPGVAKKYFELFPDDTDTRSFAHLDKLEASDPYIFISMYQFMVQKK